ncbi:MAG: peptidylprolyl isomerase [Cytophagaceae bacterium]|nr:peptidylprolyl isomerase [Cytophagaceae bacterium]|tara:strand:+ start:1108 stop:2268 length:1161 start_codon:yes stop_codon:yes gene_type:complete
MKKFSLLLLVLVLSIVSCDDKYPDLEDGIYAAITTSKGEMVAQLYYDKTPATVASFVSLAEGNSTIVDSTYKGKPFFDGLTFHRILKGFVIQGGDPDGTGMGGPGYKFQDELSPELRHDSIGVLSMANGGYETNGSQFFITLAPTPHLDGYDENGTLKNCEDPRTSCHTVFGKVVKGFDVLDAIANTEVNNPRKGDPKEPVTIEKVEIIRKGTEARRFDANEVFAQEGKKYEEEKARIEAEKQAKLKKVTDRFEAERAKADSLDSGLKLYYKEKGDGPKPKTGQTALLDYAVYFTSGELLDTSMKDIADEYGMQTRPVDSLYAPYPVKVSPDAPAIAGFIEAAKNMQVGDKVTAFVPYYLAYGERGNRGIPPKTDLVFDLVLRAVE